MEARNGKEGGGKGGGVEAKNGKEGGEEGWRLGTEKRGRRERVEG